MASAEIRKTMRHYNTPGHAHALTFSCFRMQRFLIRDRCRRWLIEAIDQARDTLQFDVWAYVIMPEHVHLLLWPRREVYDIADIQAAIKAPVARQALAWVRRQAPGFLTHMRDGSVRDGQPRHRFWQRGGGYDRNLESPRVIWNTIHYNPVRRGLVECALDWPWSSAGSYVADKDATLRIDLDSLPEEPEVHS